MTSKKPLLALAAAALLLGGCATGPYYDNYGYNDGTYYERPVYRDDVPVYRNYDYGPAYSYYSPYYVAPSIGFGLSFSNRGHGHRHWRRR